MITFGLNGLWHGGAWGFVVWGLGNGLGVAIYRAWSRSRLGRYVTIPHIVAIAMVFTFIVLVRVPFRTPDLVSALDMYGMMIGINAPGCSGLARLDRTSPSGAGAHPLDLLPLSHLRDGPELAEGRLCQWHGCCNGTCPRRSPRRLFAVHLFSSSRA